MIIRIDTREQAPLEFKEGVEIARGTVPVFDYAIDGDEHHFAVERKSVQDFVSSVVLKENWERELRKIYKARANGIEPIFYVIEGTFRDLETYNYKKYFKSGRVHPGLIYKRWRTLAYAHRVHVVFAGSATGAASAVGLLLKSRQEDITMAEENKTNLEVGSDGHAKYSPSTLKYREVCPGWTKNLHALTSAAEEGRRLHAAMETGNFSGLSQDELRLVNMCSEYIKSSTTPSDRAYREVRLDCGGLTWGTADLVIHNESAGKLELIDYKFGRVQVDDAEVNLQGWAYLLGAIDKWHPKTAQITFIMPRLNIISTAEFAAEDRERLYRRIKLVIDACENCTRDDLNPCNPQVCRFCGAASYCPALAAKNGNLLARAKIALPDNLDPEKMTDPAVVGNILDVVPQIEHWVEEVKLLAAAMAKSGAEIPGYRLMTRRGRRTLHDIIGVWNVLHEFYGVKIEDFLPACSVKIEELEKNIRKTLPPGKKDSIITGVSTKLKDAGLLEVGDDIEYLKKEQQK